MSKTRKAWLKSFNFLNLLNPSIFFIVYYMVFLGIYPLIHYLFPYLSFFSLRSETILIIYLYLASFIFASLFVLFFVFKKIYIYIGDLQNDLYNWKFSFNIFYILGIFSFLIFYIKAGNIPILAEDVEVARVELKKGIGKFVIVGTSFFSVALIARFMIKEKIKFIDYVYLLIASLFILGVGFRGPVAFLILSVILARLFSSYSYRRRLKIPFKLIFGGILLVIIISIAGYIRNKGKIDISMEILVTIFWTLAVNVYNLNYIVHYFPNMYEYWYGKTFIHDICFVLKCHHEGFLGVYLKNLFGLSFRGEGMTVTSPGEAYINLGLCGIIFHAFILGILSSYIYGILIKSNKLSSFFILFIFSINFPKIAVSGITPTLFFSMLPQLILAYIFIFLSKVNLNLKLENK